MASTDPTGTPPSPVDPLPPVPPKDGWKTTEFWLHTVAVVGSLLVAGGLMTATTEGAIESAAGKLASAIAAIAAVISAVKYGNNRTALKG